MTQKRKQRVGRLDTIGDCRHEMAKVYRCARRSELDTLDASRLVTILRTIVETINDSDLEKRITQLETQHEQKNH